MSRRHRVPLRAHSHPPRRAAVVSVFAMALIGAGAVGVSAGPPSGAVRLTPEQARVAGIGMRPVVRSDLAPGLVELVPEAASPQPSAHRLLATAPAGAVAAIADRIGQDSTTLAIVAADGSQVRVDMPGLLGAAFSPDASWLAVTDGAGQLWRVSSADGSRRQISPGPFIGPLGISGTGDVLALSVASVEAPFGSRLVEIEANTGTSRPLSDEPLVYGASALEDGGMAVVAHHPGGTVVQVLRGTTAAILADLGPGAVNVAVSPSGASIAWERSGAVYLLDTTSGRARRLGPWLNPTFSVDGKTLLVDDGPINRLVATDGSVLASLDGPAGFMACGEGCGS